jgi:hypothetical protein
MTLTFDLDLGMVDINDCIVIDGQLYRRCCVVVRFVEIENC